MQNDNSHDHLRVLVVDDDEDIVSIITFVLRDMGISHIVKAADGERALSFFKDVQPPIDLVICDWQMPGVSGLDVLKFMQKKCPEIPFLMLTGKGAFEDVVMAKEAGVTAYMVKPFTPDELQSKVRALAKGAVT